MLFKTGDGSWWGGSTEPPEPPLDPSLISRLHAITRKNQDLNVSMKFR